MVYGSACCTCKEDRSQDPVKSHNSSQDDDDVARVSTCLTRRVISRFPTISFSMGDVIVVPGREFPRRNVTAFSRF